MTIDAPRDDLYRGLAAPPLLRAEDDDPTDGSLMYGHFAVFNVWTEVDSYFEGRFLERLAPGAFKKSMKERRDLIKVQFDHGYDMNIGDALLGPIDELREDDTGAYYEVPLIDTDYNRDRILPLLQGRLMNGDMRGSLLGASFRFQVLREDWVEEPKASEDNPNALPERTIKEVRLFEFGPVCWPAYEAATAGTRSLTDHFLRRRLARLGTAERAAKFLTTDGAAPGTPDVAPVAPPPEAPDVNTGTGLSLARALTDIERLRRAS